MRTFGKVLLGLLATIGFLVVLVFVSALYAVLRIEGHHRTAVSASGPAVLAINLDDNFIEGNSGRRLEGLGLKSFISLQDALLAIRRAKTDPHIVALKANLSEHTLGIAQIQEIRDAVADFREGGKPTFLYSETIGEGEGALPGYYLASAFQTIWVQPSGSVGIAGIGTEEFFLKKFFDRIGVKGSFVQRKEYKSAPEMFTASAMSPANREAMTALVGSWFEQMTTGIAADRHIDAADVKALVDKGPELASEALDSHLIDHVGYRDEFEAALKTQLKTGDSVSLVRYASANASTVAGAKRIAVVHAVGEIDRAEGPQSVLGGTGIHAKQMSDAIHKAADDARIVAILIRIDSPGGDYVASDTIWREIIKAKEKHKPVIVSMGDTAASGGYFIAMPADRIFAEPATITGSIGVFAGKFVVGDALAKLDIGHDRVVFGDSAGTFSSTSDFSPADLDRLNRTLDATYADFTGKAAQGRGKSQAEIEQVARGRVWSGADALKVGLVDEMGGFTDAIGYTKTKIGLKADDAVTLVPFPAPEQPWEELFKSFQDGDMPLSATAFVKTAAWLQTALQPFVAAVSASDARGPQLYLAPITIK